MTDDLKARLLRPIVGIENRTAQEVFDIMSDRIRSARIEALEAALKPFAYCCEYIGADEDDEEWAKFRLLIKDYRRARAALAGGVDE